QDPYAACECSFRAGVGVLWDRSQACYRKIAPSGQRSDRHIVLLAVLLMRGCLGSLASEPPRTLSRRFFFAQLARCECGSLCERGEAAARNKNHLEPAKQKKPPAREVFHKSPCSVPCVRRLPALPARARV